MTRRAKYILLALGCVGVVAACSYRSTHARFSCAKCRSLRYLSDRSLFSVGIWHSERLELTLSVPATHVHDWWRYSLHKSTVVSQTLACKPYRFADQTDSK